MIERLRIDALEDKTYLEALNDKVNDIYAMTYAIAMFISPIIGAHMFKAFGPR